MSVGIKTNITSQVVQNNLRRSNEKMTKELNRLSSGKRIVTASDDPAGLGVGTRLEAQVKGLKQAERNADNGLSLVQTAEGALNEISSLLIRLRELSIQSSSDTVGENERDMIDIEYQQLKDEIDRISESTTFNGVPLLVGDTGGDDEMDFQVGVFKGDENVIQFETEEINSTTDNLGIDGTEVADKGDALDSLEDIDDAINMVSHQRAALGAIQSRLHSSINSIESQNINQTMAKSKIMDTDVADSTSKLASANIMRAAGVSALAQANNLPYGLLKLVG